MDSAQATTMRFRSGVSWTKALLLSALITTVLFVALSWHSCGPMLRDPEDFLLFGLLFAWFGAFFLVRSVWRVLFVVVTLILILLPGSEPYARAEAYCVGALRQMNSSIEAAHATNGRREYPATFMIPKVPVPARKYFKFEYVPHRSGDGRVEGYTIQATPICRENGPPRSFSIAEDGAVYYTTEPRAATLSDSRLEQIQSR